MSLTMVGFGLLFAFVVVIWAALVLWALICPSMPHETEEMEVQAQLPPPLPPRVPVARQAGKPDFPVMIMQEGPPIMAVKLPEEEDDKIVSLSEWRDRREGTG